MRFEDWSKIKPVIGMLHLPALPGSPNFRGGLDEIVARALADAEILAQGGCQALMMENFGDVPFFAGRVPSHVVAAMTRVACEVKRRHDLPLGINVLRNDGLSALAVAAAAGADFIRINVLTGARVTDQGVIQGIAADLARERIHLAARHIRILADVDVKHSAPLAARPIADEVKDMLDRGMADAVIVSGSGTGAAVDIEKLKAVKAAAGRRLVLVGSGVTPQTIGALSVHADGFIVGTAMKIGGNANNAVDPLKVKELFTARSAKG